MKIYCYSIKHHRDPTYYNFTYPYCIACRRKDICQILSRQLSIEVTTNKSNLNTIFQEKKKHYNLLAHRNYQNIFSGNNSNFKSNKIIPTLQSWIGLHKKNFFTIFTFWNFVHINSKRQCKTNIIFIYALPFFEPNKMRRTKITYNLK